MDKILDELNKKNINDAIVKLFIKSNGEYVILPYSENRINKFLGYTQLNYCQTGNYKSDDAADLENKLYASLLTSVNNEQYEQKEANPEFIKSFLKQGAEVGFKNYYYFTISLSKDGTVELVYSVPQDKKGKEWWSKPEYVHKFDVNETKKLMSKINEYIVPPMR